MNKDKILKEILKSPELKEKYWPNIDVDAYNISTLLREDSMYLRTLYYIFEESNKTKFTGMIKNIKNAFKL